MAFYVELSVVTSNFFHISFVVGMTKELAWSQNSITYKPASIFPGDDGGKTKPKQAF